MKSRLTYKHTLYACYIGYITQAIINNLTPLLFVTFQNRFDISLSQIGILIFVNFGVQILVDLLGAKYADKIGHANDGPHHNEDAEHPDAEEGEAVITDLLSESICKLRQHNISILPFSRSF